MKKQTLLTWILLLICLPFAASAFSSDDILGFWITEGKDTMIEIYKKGDTYSGRIVSLKYPTYSEGEMQGKAKVDKMNPDESMRSRPLVGIELILGFRYEQGKWIDGTIYDPDNGKTYNCIIFLAQDGMLDVRGYIGISLLGRTTKWERLETYLDREFTFLNQSCTCPKKPSP